jgi:hypothetical protein
MKIRVLFSRPYALGELSKLILWSEKTPFSHVSMLMEDGNVYEAVYPEYWGIAFHEWNKYNEVVKSVDFKVTDEEYEAVAAKIKELIGKRYSFLQLLLIQMENISKKIIKPIGEMIGAIKLNNNRMLICTESCILLLMQIGLKYSGSRDTISLNDFDSIVSQFKKERIK